MPNKNKNPRKGVKVVTEKQSRMDALLQSLENVIFTKKTVAKTTKNNKK